MNLLSIYVSGEMDDMKRREHLIQTIISSEPDLVALQGISYPDYKALQSALKYYRGFTSVETALFIRESLTDSSEFRAENEGSSLSVGGVRIYSVSLEPEEVTTFLERADQKSVVIGHLIVSKKTLFDRRFIDGLQAIGNFESTQPFNSEPKITERVLVRGVRIISGDVLDFGLWAFSDEIERADRLLERCGSDHFPIKATLNYILSKR